MSLKHTRNNLVSPGENVMASDDMGSDAIVMWNSRVLRGWMCRYALQIRFTDPMLKHMGMATY